MNPAFPNGKQDTNLGPDGGDARQIRAKCCARAGVSSQLIKVVADGADKELLVQEARSFQIRMPINSVLIIGVGILEIIGQGRDCREFKACGLIE